MTESGRMDAFDELARLGLVDMLEICTARRFIPFDSQGLLWCDWAMNPPRRRQAPLSVIGNPLRLARTKL
jgi:hypothetical protein